jgi:hypothetical protein
MMVGFGGHYFAPDFAPAVAGAGLKIALAPPETQRRASGAKKLAPVKQTVKPLVLFF